MEQAALSKSPRLEYMGEASGCCYILADCGPPRACGAARQSGSPYCAQHHALCYLGGGTKAEARRLREVEALATAVGGRCGSDGAGPSARFLKKLEQAVRDFS